MQRSAESQSLQSHAVQPNFAEIHFILNTSSNFRYQHFKTCQNDFNRDMSQMMCKKPTVFPFDATLKNMEF